MASLLVINGPNLNLLGLREPDIYGRTTLADLEARLIARATALGHAAACFQANGEGELVSRIHQAGREGVAFIVINPGAYTHTSVALRDALLENGGIRVALTRDDDRYLMLAERSSIARRPIGNW